MSACECVHHPRMHTNDGCQAIRIEKGWMVGCRCRGTADAAAAARIGGDQ